MCRVEVGSVGSFPSNEKILPGPSSPAFEIINVIGLPGYQSGSLRSAETKKEIFGEAKDWKSFELFTFHAVSKNEGDLSEGKENAPNGSELPAISTFNLRVKRGNESAASRVI